LHQDTAHVGVFESLVLALPSRTTEQSASAAGDALPCLGGMQPISRAPQLAGATCGRTDVAGQVANRFCRVAVSLEVSTEIAMHLDFSSVLGRLGRGNKRGRSGSCSGMSSLLV